MTEFPRRSASRLAQHEQLPAADRGLLWALLFGNFVTGTGILLPAGMLTELAEGLDVSLPAAGNLLLVSGFVVAVGAPLIAAFTSRVDRRIMLLLALGIYIVTHVAAACAPNFELLIASRLGMGISAAIFTPQAAATVGVLLPPHRRAAAITMIFIGWSLATVGGMPLGGYVAHEYGWRVAFGIVAVLSAIAVLALAVTVPGGVRIPKLGLASWISVATNPALLLVLLVTTLNGTGQFTFFTYLNPSLKESLGASAALLTFVLAWYGVSATAGNVIASRFVSRIGASRSALATLLAMAAGLALWGAGAGTLWVVMVAAVLWGLGTFATNSIQQARLAGLAPDLTSASIALNTSAIYLGQAFGSGFGGVLVNGGYLPFLPWVAAAILIVAAGVSMAAMRWEHS
jgi:DHA1 family inner membrane transport protein